MYAVITTAEPTSASVSTSTESSQAAPSPPVSGYLQLHLSSQKSLRSLIMMIYITAVLLS